MHLKRALTFWSSTVVNAPLWDPDQRFSVFHILDSSPLNIHCVPAEEKQSLVFLRSLSCVQAHSY